MTVTFHLINSSLWKTSVSVPKTATRTKVKIVIFSSLRYSTQLATSASPVATTSAPAAAARLFPWVAAMLERVHARQLRELTFALEVARAADLAALDWARVDARLGGEAFRGLGVAFVVTCDEDGVAEDVKKEIGAQLAGFQERGTLSVSCI